MEHAESDGDSLVGHGLGALHSGPLRGTMRVPGDKSISHRALMLSLLAVGESRLEGLLEGADVLATARAVCALGAQITREPTGAWRVYGRGIGGLSEPHDVLDMGNSGTSARLLSGILASHPIFSVMTGDASLRKRPMRRIIEPLAACGAHFSARYGGLLPMAIEGATDATPLTYALPVPSAQVKSAVLLAGLNARGVTEVHESTPTRDHTEKMLQHFGGEIAVDRDDRGTHIRLSGQPELRGASLSIPADFSSAAFPLVAALLVPDSDLRLEGVGINPLRTGLLSALAEMGAMISIVGQRVEGGEPVGDIIARYGPLRAADVAPERAPTMIDEYPILAVAAAFASGTTRLRGLAELRVKESDRLATTAALLAANGVRVEITGDDLLIHGTGHAPDGGARIAAALDHRIAMSALVLGLAAKAPVEVDDVRCIATSFPQFTTLLGGVGARFRVP